MAMRCPGCGGKTFTVQRAAGGLEAAVCGGCGGMWVSVQRYFAFLAERESGDQSSPGPATPGEEAGADSEALKLCPVCQKFMRYYPVGHGLAFGVDRCGDCGGFFLNAKEWEALAAHGLETRLHFIPSDAWQAEVARGLRTAHDAESLVRRLGAEDAAELERVTEWIAGHRHRDVMMAHLRERLHLPVHG